LSLDSAAELHVCCFEEVQVANLPGLGVSAKGPARGADLGFHLFASVSCFKDNIESHDLAGNRIRLSDCPSKENALQRAHKRLYVVRMDLHPSDID